MDKVNKYFAFISYKREDEKWAKWLQYKLEHYSLPSNLNGRTDLPKEIRPIFRDQSDLSGGVLADEINQALENSKYLLVVCSPRSAQSEWVGREVQAFIDSGRSDKIIPFVIGGTAYSKDPDEECFPLALRTLPPDKELLGVNINEMGRDAAVVKVVARMFNINFDVLWQRFGREQKRKRLLLTIAFVLFMLICIGVGGYIVNKNIELDKANENLENANNNIREERDNVKNANWKIMENQSRLVAEKAARMIDEGDSYLLQRLLLEVLPKDLSNPDRPYTTEAEAAFRKTIKYNNAILRGHINGILHLAFSPDDKNLISISDRGSYVWKLSSGYGKKLDIKAKRGCYSPDGKYVLLLMKSSNDTASVSSVLKLIDANKINNVETIEADYTAEMEKEIESASEIAYSPDGKKIFVATNKNILLFDADKFIPLDTLNVVCDKLSMHSISQDGNKLCCFKYYDEGYASIIDIKTKNIVQIKEKNIRFMAFSPNGEMVVTTSNDGTKLWDTKGNQIRTIDSSSADGAAFCSDGRFIAIVSRAGPVYLKSIDDGNLVKDPFGEQEQAFSVSFNSNGSLLAISSDSTIRILDIYGGLPTISDKEEADGNKKDIVSPDGELKIISESDELRKVISQKTGKVQFELSDSLKLIDFSPDSKTIFITSLWRRTNYIVDANKGDTLVEIPYNNPNAAVFSPDGKYVALGAIDKIYIWNIENGQPETPDTTIDLGGSIQSLSYSRDGKYLACNIRNSELNILDTKSWIRVVDYSIPQFNDEDITVEFAESSVILDMGKCQYTYEFLPLQELIDKTRERFKECPLTKDERRRYLLEY